MKSLLYVAVAICLVGYVCSAEAEDSAKERFVALYRTATYITISTSTVSQFYICQSTSSAAACTGRKRRKRRADMLQKVAPELLEAQAAQLQGSMAEDVAPVEAGSREGRLGFTVWTTSTSTITLTTTSFNSATTISLVYLCTSSGASTVPSC
ncbi:uncharacterized protein LOC119103812 [Pollicipes pollicipes]|uniref:uncharacterized protein LOC119103812 n=1 Tax=Pollicipes pollicipes TaxID=41117 RepID=UPI0018851573|nr:uncharacterized protein LOC119103812 [Pollicipes pollicipes]